MHELPESIPDVEEFLALEPEEIGLKLLFFLRDRPANERDMFDAGSMENELFEARIDRPRYPRERAAVCGLAFREAFAWLEAQGMIVPAEGPNGSNGWRVLSRRAETFQNPADFKSFLEGRRLNKELLHPTIVDDVWMSFIRRQYDIAVFQAMKAVEIAVREAAGFDVSQHGVPMVRNAFHKDNGPLRDPDQQEAEREALMHLFAGAIGSYKNPHSHRAVPMDDPSEAMEIVYLASHLLRIVDARRP